MFGLGSYLTPFGCSLSETYRIGISEYSKEKNWS